MNNNIVTFDIEQFRVSTKTTDNSITTAEGPLNINDVVITRIDYLLGGEKKTARDDGDLRNQITALFHARPDLDEIVIEFEAQPKHLVYVSTEALNNNSRSYIVDELGITPALIVRQFVAGRWLPVGVFDKVEMIGKSELVMEKITLPHRTVSAAIFTPEPIKVLVKKSSRSLIESELKYGC